MKYLVLILLLVGCSRERPKVVLTDLQKQYIASLPIEGKVFFEECILNYGSFLYCIERYKDLGVPTTKSSSAVKDIAIGTTIGTVLGKSLTK